MATASRQHHPEQFTALQGEKLANANPHRPQRSLGWRMSRLVITASGQRITRQYQDMNPNYDPNLGKITVVSPGYIGRVFLNLINNAC